MLFSISSCEDPITAIATEDVRLASLPDRVLIIQAPADGTVSPSAGTYTMKDGEPLEISATANSGYSFLFWEKIAGSGTVVFDDETAASTKAHLSGGDATIRPRVDDTNYVITLSHSAGGTVLPTSLSANKGEESLNITATPDAEYLFSGWTVTAGLASGISFNPNASTTPVKITANSGDATVQANFALKTYTLTMTNDGHGYTTPSGNRTVSSGVATAIVATAYPTWIFNGWTKTAGAGTVSFGNAANASTTVTITGGAATISANFRKEALTFTEVGSLAFNISQTTYPSDAQALYVNGNYLFVLGYAYTAGSSTALRRVNISSPTAPTTGSNDYKYVTGHGTSLAGNGTYLLTGSDTNIYRTDPSATNFAAAVVTTPSSAIPVKYLDADSNTSYFWALTSTGYIRMHQYSNLAAVAYQINDADGWSLDSFFRTYSGILAVQRKNGANQVAGYDFATSGDQLSSPDSTNLLHNGADMDPGWAGRPAPDSSREYFTVPVVDENGFAKLPIYDATVLTDMPGSLQGTATLAGEAVNDAFFGDYYIYAAGVNGNTAYVSVVDATDYSNLVVRKTLTITGFEEASLIYERNGYLYVLADTSAGAPVLKVYSIASN